MFPFQTKKHTPDYLILLSVLASTTLAIKIFNLNKSTLPLLSVFVSVVYIVWGVTHHKKAGHIDQKIMLEYISLALLVNLLILSFYI